MRDQNAEIRFHDGRRRVVALAAGAAAAELGPQTESAISGGCQFAQPKMGRVHDVRCNGLAVRASPNQMELAPLHLRIAELEGLKKIGIFRLYVRKLSLGA